MLPPVLRWFSLARDKPGMPRLMQARRAKLLWCCAGMPLPVLAAPTGLLRRARRRCRQPATPHARLQELIRAAIVSMMSNCFHALQPDGRLTQFVLGEPMLFVTMLECFYSAIIDIANDCKAFRIVFHDAWIPVRGCTTGFPFGIRKLPNDLVWALSFHYYSA